MNARKPLPAVLLSLCVACGTGTGAGGDSSTTTTMEPAQSSSAEDAGGGGEDEDTNPFGLIVVDHGDVRPHLIEEDGDAGAESVEEEEETEAQPGPEFITGFELHVDPERLSLSPGDTGVLDLEVDRFGEIRAITVSAEIPLQNVAVTPVELGEDEDGRTLRVVVGKDAPFGRFVLRVVAESGEFQVEDEVSLTIRPLPGVLDED